MPNFNWNEVRDNAIAFARNWAEATREHSDKQSFWNDFFAVFGRERRTVASFEVAVKNIQGKYNFIDLLWGGVLLVEHKTAGKSLSAAESQAFQYIADLIRADPESKPPRYIILSDFQRFALYDLEPDLDEKSLAQLPNFSGIRYTQFEFPLSEFHQHIRQFAFVKGERTLRLDPEDPANEKAYRLMSGLHDPLAAAGLSGSDLEKFLVRILFCLFAEDTEVFEPNTFRSFIQQHTKEDGSNLGAQLNELFYYLNIPKEKWPPSILETYGNFKYINGQLFADPIAFAPFNRLMRTKLLEAADFHWAQVSPAVFGSLFQGILEEKARRQQGAHYTSERDILKVVRSLFLDELRAEFESIKADRSNRRTKLLEAFHDKLRSLRFLDPACGCGNFLVLAYREMRLLELELLQALHTSGQRLLDVRSLIKVDVDQFYGIEIAEWPARIAEVALWLMDHQMNLKASITFGQNCDRLPLKSTPHIVQGNALRMDWREVLPPNEGVYVLGNPPFVGKHYQNTEQKADMDIIWSDVKGSGILDYVTCWYKKAAEYIGRLSVKVAFVSTNSISQGEQPGLMWPELFKRRLKIHFAHRTVAWISEARGKAHVHVVIIGFGNDYQTDKRIYDYDENEENPKVSRVLNISPYLVAGGDVVLQKRSRPICGQPEIVFGSMPNDGGHLLLTSDERVELLAEEPDAKRFIRPLLGSEEFINGIKRWCLWLVDVEPHEYRKLKSVMMRIEKVIAHRAASVRATTRELSKTAALFGEIRQPAKRYLAIPSVSSERRNYIPMAFLPASVIASNLLLVVPEARIFHFGVLSSALHMAWIRTVGGRLESRYRYSNKIVYNNFPWPEKPTEKQKQAVETAAQAVLDARSRFLPPEGKSNYADLYDPRTMPAPLVKAHAALDRAVERCYRSAPFRSDRERIEHLFAQYETLINPLLPVEPKRKASLKN